MKITHPDRVNFAIQSRSHTILCDQPAENGGEDSGITPPELLLAPLGSCAAFYAMQYLKTRHLAETGVEVAPTLYHRRKQDAVKLRIVCVTFTLVPDHAAERKMLERSDACLEVIGRLEGMPLQRIGRVFQVLCGPLPAPGHDEIRIPPVD